MIYIGIDVHKKNLEVCLIDESGEHIERRKVSNGPGSVAAYFEKVSLSVSVAMEPTHNWAMLYDTLEQLCMLLYGIGCQVYFAEKIEKANDISISTARGTNLASRRCCHIKHEEASGRVYASGLIFSCETGLM